MSFQLETATVASDTLRRIAIDPVSRVEGHGKVTILLDEDNKVHQVRLHIVEFRGFERFIQGRPYWEVPVMVQRLCGICPVSHHLAASKALDLVVGAARVTPTADKMRRLMHYGQILQSHALHFFHLSSPDLLFGFGSELGRRNIVGVAQQYPDIAKKGILLRKFGQEVIRLTAGKRVHGTGAVPGGVNRALSADERKLLLADAYQMIAWSRDAVRIIKELHQQDRALYDHFGTVRSSFMGLVAPDGSLDLYHGVLRARDADGRILFDQVDYQTYDRLITEEVKPWSYMKFPYFTSMGPEAGWYKVGPLARVQNCDSIPTPFAEHERRELVAYAGGKPLHGSLAFHWARMIEMLFAAETIKDLLHDDDLSGTELMTSGERRREGVGVIEAPRGTLFHHYQVGDDDLVTMANLIVSTTNNNQAMNTAVREVAKQYLHGQEITEGLLNHIEVAIRAFDPCLSCATHALGQMPLEVTLVDAEGTELDRKYKA
ncbi:MULTISPECIES: Ni/Fe hydrogenase subunit alpha [Thauera]|jgi:NAD-reducing hydrogenase large subunit|uniref:Nickel-dependent hydrogenase large subunit n=1 Tax=Thauera aminoaromatica TaxID=164330 RepID=C4ZJZ8_THASP|nr:MULTISPECIES: Ni/Fe hydrogenase subunit alpha [Thauera]OPZ04212.1 MAG: NAD-reducing hydrogenase HoxS subunit beta [Alphaproteobacteria bacterium ADurb.BinA305]ACK54989.1 nickel-dependent hydrogenase large subunit [Thauera aminoaromatica]KIN90780.1 NAD-reducing hydrogenase hoxS subunit beta [Thauera sp. SWB20]MBP6131602.1 Ni/Fe hydrogenase subunit alpha [Thauera sp.]MBP7046123.1 Ni/Fe hydrogenase subunit alpha [Thauera sp.]